MVGMLWEIVIGAVVLVLVPLALWLLLRLRWHRAGYVPEDMYRLLVAWRAAQCKAEIRAAASTTRRQLWAELEDIERRERGCQ